MSGRVDLAIVGASFAGLACAKRAAERGLAVAVVERKAEPGERVHTTGILVQEAQDRLHAPPHLLRRVPGVRLYAPNLRAVDLESAGYAFYATDTPGLLRWMAQEAQAAGATLRCGAAFAAAAPSEGGWRLSGLDLEARYLIGADGARSAVAESLGLGRNTRFLVGLEAEYRGLGGVDERFLHTFLDRRAAPGYIGWAVPGVGVTQIGVAAKRADKPELAAFQDKIAGLFDFSRADIVERRSGLIPCGGAVRPAGTQRALLIGDAAGLVSPLTAGGIKLALEFGPRAADGVADFLAGAGPDPAFALPRTYPRFRAKALLRRIADAGAPDWLMNALIGTRPMQGLARLVYFHTKGLGSRAAWRDLARRAPRSR